MKKILCLTLVGLSFAGSAFATSLVTAGSGYAIRGGADDATAAAAPTPLIKFSSGVFGIVNFTPDPAPAKTCPGYLIGARHASGSKNFATANTITNIYWKQVSAGATGTALANDVTDSAVAATVFAPGNGWTSY